MGFYQSSSETRERQRSNPHWRNWLAVALVSAAIGSGSTLGVLKYAGNTQTLGTLTESSVPSSSASPTTTNVSVNVNSAMTDIVKKIVPSVVAVVNYQSQSDFFNQQSSLQESGVGTGVLVAKDNQYGYVVTNNHVVNGAAKLEMVLNSGKHVQATLVGADPFTDLAVIRIPVSQVSGIEPATFGNSDTLQVGEPVLAVGTPMGLDFQDSVTSGIISAKQRVMPVQIPDTQQVLDYQTVVQTDAAINPGNSGGPLVNMQGQVIAINSSKIVDQSVQGMGFGIPSNQVHTIVEQIIQTGHASHPSLGIKGYSLSAIPDGMRPNVPVTDGFYVQQVASSDATKAGLKPEDVVVSVNGHTVTSDADLRTYLFSLKVGQTVAVQVYRGNQKLTLNVPLQAMNTQG